MRYNKYYCSDGETVTPIDMEEHDRQVAETERNRILDEMEKFVKTKKFIDGYGDMLYAFDLNIEINRLRKGAE